MDDKGGEGEGWKGFIPLVVIFYPFTSLKPIAHLLEVPGAEVLTRPTTHGSAAEARLEREAIHQAKLFETHHSSGATLALLDLHGRDAMRVVNIS